MRLTRRAIPAIAAAFAALAAPALAGPLAPRPGWVTLPTPHDFPTLIARVEAATKAAGMGLVNAASASEGARAQGIAIPGNRVVGVFRNDFARRMLGRSLAAGIEAPIRLYLTENPDRTATLSYRTPTAVFAPYFDEGGEGLRALAAELDDLFDRIAREAAKSG